MTRNVLYINIPPYTGGAEISLLTLMRHLDPARYRPVLLTSGEGQLVEAARGNGIETLIQEFPWFSRRYFWRYPGSIVRLASTVRRRQVALVHTNCDRSLRYVMRAARLARVPYVSHVRDFTRSWFQPEKVEVLSRAARVVGNSEAIAEACIQAGIDQDRVVVIYNPIHLPAFDEVSPEAVAAVRAELGIPRSALVMGVVGQVYPEKGQGDFVEAAIRLASGVPNSHYLIVGAIPASPRFQAFADSLHLRVQESGFADRIHFLGFREDVPALMHAMDILTVPSWTESFGRVAAEGQAAGCAVVGTNAGGLPEIITHGLDGLLVMPRDVDGLVEAMRLLVEDPGLRRRLGKEGRERVKRFSVERHLQTMQALYDTVLSERSQA